MQAKRKNRDASEIFNKSLSCPFLEHYCLLHRRILLILNLNPNEKIVFVINPSERTFKDIFPLPSTTMAAANAGSSMSIDGQVDRFPVEWMNNFARLIAITDH